MLLLLAAVIAATVASHLFSPVDWPPLAIDILHSLHGPGFALIALAVFCYLQSRCVSTINYLLAAGIAMGIGLVSEIAQIPGPRDAQFKDLLVDGIGILGALGIAASLDRRVRSALSRPAHLLLPAVAGVALAIACMPTLWYSYALLSQQRAFPVLLSFEHAWEMATISKTNGVKPSRIAAPDDWPVVGATIVQGTEAGRWGIFLSLHPLPDWQGYAKLSFVAASVDAEFPMAFCVRDTRPDRKSRRNRFCKHLTVSSEAQRFVVEFDEIQSTMKDRAFDFTRVAALVFSASKPGGGNELLLDDIRLEL